MKHVYYLRVCLGLNILEKVIICSNKKELDNIIDDFFPDFDFYIAITYDKIQSILNEIRNRKEKHFYLKLSNKNNNLKEEFIYEKKKYINRNFLLDENFLISAIILIQLKIENDDVIYDNLN